jgi:hypothetical protein
VSEALTARQEFVLARLYIEHGWSVPRLAASLSLGRRLIENALRRQNVELRRGRASHVSGTLTDEAAVSWFTEAKRPERAMEDPAPQTRAATSALGEVSLVFRDRRCQACGVTNHYVNDCVACGAPLNYRKPDKLAAEIADLFQEVQHRE